MIWPFLVCYSSAIGSAEHFIVIAIVVAVVVVALIVVVVVASVVIDAVVILVLVCSPFSIFITSLIGSDAL
jgi:hypothetical protein